jgi:phage gp45-like
MGKLEQLEARITQLEARLNQRIANLIKLAPVALATSDGKADGVEGLPSDESFQMQSQRIQHAGFRSRPPAQSQAVLVEAEGSAVKLIQIAEDDGLASRVPLDEGESAVYSPNEPGCRAYFDKNGVLHLNGMAGELAADVIVNNGTEKVARVGDHGNVGTLQLTVAGASGVTIAAVYTDPDGTVHTIPASASITISLANKNTEGADNFKA